VVAEDGSAKADDGGTAENSDAAAGSDSKKKARAFELLGELGDYELLEEVGRGGQGVVFRARQKSLNRTVALKVISLGQWASKAHVKRFRREAEAAASLDHPSIVPIHEVGERDGQCYFSMKFIEGGQLDEVVARASVSIREAAELIAKLARTVHYAHEHGIIHRDIKPGNILLNANGEPHLTDFGLARLVETESTVTRTLEVMGTPSYMAPEQAVGNNAAVNRATDVYGLGAVLYLLLTGHPPFAGGTSYQTIRLLLDTEPRRPRLWNRKIGRDLSTICLKCLEKNPKRRYSSALALAEDLEHWLSHEPILARHTGAFARGRKWVRRNPSSAVLAAALLALAAVVGWNVWTSELFRPVPEKSIAVLPFENLSRDPDNAYFAEGVQDEILNSLARIADLKVIGRTSVMQYKSGGARNLRKIGKQLGVAHLVEGSVQRSGNHVRVNAQLIDGRTERSLWGHSYDGDLADFFAIQTQIAMAIANTLHATLSPQEKSEIERPATKDITAFDFYTGAKQLVLTPAFSVSSKPKLLLAADLLNRSVAHDPSFFRGYCQLAFVHDALYFFGHDRTPARLALAETALEAASSLRPDAGEMHLARAWNLYWGYLDYHGALAEVEVARQTLPNAPQVLFLTGLIQRRQGRWEESTRTFQRAADLDPRNFGVLQNIAGNYATLGRYAEQQMWLRRVLAFEPNDAGTNVILAAVDFEWRGDTGPLHQMTDSIRATNPAAVPDIDNWWLHCALAERDAAAATAALAATGQNPIDLGNDVYCSRPFMEGVIARMAKDDDKARSAFTAARAEQEKIVQAQPQFGPPWCVLGLIDAALGRKEEALREARHAVELLPLEKDAVRGPAMIKYLAMIAAWTGDKDLACQHLAVAARPPSTVSYGQLKLLPFWDPLRGDPCFERIVASVAPKVIGKSTADKSIAVLPFEDLSDDKERPFFADGLQDDVLTKLAKVADLKVIGRTSVMQYRGKQDLGEMGRVLGVSHVLEGTVRRFNGRVHINARLADTRTGTDVWAEEYERDLNEVFAIEAELAQSVANRLRANVSASETLAMQEQPTSDLVAYDLYTRAKNVLAVRNARANLLEGVDLLNQSIAQDPSFFKAYCQLAQTHDRLYFLGYDHTPARLALAEAAIQSAFGLRPDAGEAHLARAQHLYRGYLEYDTALAELEVAARTLPNDAAVFELKGYIQRRQGKQEQAVYSLERAIEIDPRNTFTLQQIGLSYHHLRRYAKEKSVLDRALAIEPDDIDCQVARAFVDFHWKAHTRLLHQALDSIRATNPAATKSIADGWLICALAERDAGSAKNAVIAAGENPPFTDEALNFSRPFVEGVIALTTEDDEKARSAFTAARIEQEKIIQAQPNYGPPLCVLGLIDAALGRKEDALREGRRAVELLPVEKDPINGIAMIKYLAMIAAWAGDKDLACEQLALAIRPPSRLTYGQLKLLPFWDPLRGDPRFEKIVASLAPK
jgi:TolB-like protein/Tfp pilus assembly protein PilF